MKDGEPGKPRSCPSCGGMGLITQLVDGVMLTVPCACTRQGRQGHLWPPRRG